LVFQFNTSHTPCIQSGFQVPSAGNIRLWLDYLLDRKEMQGSLELARDKFGTNGSLNKQLVLVNLEFFC